MWYPQAVLLLHRMKKPVFVWGMPRAVTETRICSAVLPLEGRCPLPDKGMLMTPDDFEFISQLLKKRSG